MPSHAQRSGLQSMFEIRYVDVHQGDELVAGLRRFALASGVHRDHSAGVGGACRKAGEPISAGGGGRGREALRTHNHATRDGGAGDVEPSDGAATIGSNLPNDNGLGGAGI